MLGMRYQVACDEVFSCPATGPSAATPGKAREKAAEHGWDVGPRRHSVSFGVTVTIGTDYCPHHQRSSFLADDWPW